MGKGSGNIQRPAVYLHDTKSKQDLALEAESDKVGIYVCGPTVYDRIHIGNARPFVVYASLKRFLKYIGFDPVLVSNITDINDKIHQAAKHQKISSQELSELMTQHYIQDTDKLGLGRPDYEPLVSQSMQSIIDMIQKLIDEGAAYQSNGDVYFKVESDELYGSLSHRQTEQMNQGEDNRLKQNPLDFALWKANKQGEDTSWDSPWGQGRPGWHIECSAMAQQTLGLQFDIHGGGNDLIFPHHENEAAQTRMAYGIELAKIWMHNGMLQLGDSKMAKSIGNVANLDKTIEKWGRHTLLYFFASGHYRQPLQFDDNTLQAALRNVEKISKLDHLTKGESPQELLIHKQNFVEALSQDFNTPKALTHMHAWINQSKNYQSCPDQDLRDMLYILGIEDLLDKQTKQPSRHELDLLDRRNKARGLGDYAEADKIRDQLQSSGWDIKDSPSGSQLVYKN